MTDRIVGVDEAGRGPLAGPVVGAAVLLPDGFHHDLIRDSKALSPTQREKMFEVITSNALAYKIVAVGPRRIDSLNILRASLFAMAKAASAINPTFILVDGNQLLPISTEQQCVIGGDAIHPCISAASILAKVYRDRLMKKLDLKFSQYGFKQHQGYPTKAHYQALALYGASSAHRQSFRGVLPKKPTLEVGIR